MPVLRPGEELLVERCVKIDGPGQPALRPGEIEIVYCRDNQSVEGERCGNRQSIAKFVNCARERLSNGRHILAFSKFVQEKQT